MASVPAGTDVTQLLESLPHGDGVPIVYPKGKPLITVRIITEIPPCAAPSWKRRIGT